MLVPYKEWDEKVVGPVDAHLKNNEKSTWSRINWMVRKLVVPFHLSRSRCPINFDWSLRVRLKFYWAPDSEEINLKKVQQGLKNERLCRYL